MCGFIGSVSKNEILHNDLEKCNEQLICRGPDKKKTLETSEDNFNFKGIFNQNFLFEIQRIKTMSLVFQHHFKNI